MNQRRRNIWIAVAAFAGVLAVAALVSRITIPADAFKPQFEAASSDPLGLRVTIGGRLGIRFTGNLQFAMGDVHVRNSSGEELLSAEHATISVAPLPLLFNQSYIHRIELVRPRIAIERGPDGALNWSKRAIPRGMTPVLAWATFAVEDGIVQYKDQGSGAVLNGAQVNVQVRKLKRERQQMPGPLDGLSFRAKAECGQIQVRGISATDVSFTARARNGVVDLDPIAMRVLGGKVLANLRADWTDSIPSYRLRCTLSQARIGECLRTLSPDTVVSGAMDLAANLSMKGRAPAEWTRSLEGDVNIKGHDITLHGLDLDQDIARFQSSHTLDLAGVGSFFLVGPLGPAVAKGFDVARFTIHSGGTTQIRSIVSTWDVKDGMMEAKDVAMATSKNRVALKGSLDFVHQEFDSVTVALIDKEGCAKVRQELRGTFQKPELTKPTLLTSLLGPARSVYSTVKGLLPGGPCTVFYAGSVEPPE